MTTTSWVLSDRLWATLAGYLYDRLLGLSLFLGRSPGFPTLPRGFKRIYSGSLSMDYDLADYMARVQGFDFGRGVRGLSFFSSGYSIVSIREGALFFFFATRMIDRSLCPYLF